MPSMILAAKSPGEELFFVLDPEDPAVDGVVVEGDEVDYVPFWGYLTANSRLYSPVKSNEFQKRLWSEEQPKGAEWFEKFIDRTQEFEDRDLRLVQNDIIPVPPRRIYKITVDSLLEKETDSDATSKTKTAWNRIVFLGEDKALPRIGKPGKGGKRKLKPAALDPDSVDADLDGWHQEGTTAQWYGLGKNNPIFQAVDAAFKEDGPKVQLTDRMIEDRRALDEMRNAPPVMESNLLIDTMFISGLLEDFTDDYGRLNDNNLKGAVEWLAYRESTRGNSLNEINTDREPKESVDLPKFVETQIVERRNKRKQRDAQIKDAVERRLSEAERKKLQDLDLEGFAASDYDTWLETYKTTNPEPWPDAFDTDEEFGDAYQAWEDEAEVAWSQLSTNDPTGEALSEAFTFRFTGINGKRYESSVTSVEALDDEIYIHGNIREIGPNGEYLDSAAEWTRILQPNEKLVKHEVLRVNRNHRDAGISGTFNASNMQVYEALGMETIFAQAISSPRDWNGVSHWPKQGFDFYDDDYRQMVLDELEEAIAAYEDFMKSSKNAVPMLDYNEFQYDADGNETIIPREVALFETKEQYEELKAMVAYAKGQDFDDPDRLTAGDFMFFSGAEVWFKRKRNEIWYHMPVAPKQD